MQNNFHFQNKFHLSASELSHVEEIRFTYNINFYNHNPRWSKQNPPPPPQKKDKIRIKKNNVKFAAIWVIFIILP